MTALLGMGATVGELRTSERRMGGNGIVSPHQERLPEPSPDRGDKSRRGLRASGPHTLPPTHVLLLLTPLGRTQGLPAALGLRPQAGPPPLRVLEEPYRRAS